MTWKGDLPPHHVHVYRDGRLVLKFDLESRVAMKGKAIRRIMNLIADLEREGML